MSYAGCKRLLSGLSLSLLVNSAFFSSAAHADGVCSAHSAASVPPVVELYTSEGCSSCPSADRWLSGLKRDSGIVALAFHVDYWDRLGWKDRFASPAFSLRQADEQSRNGADFSYTPQVVLDGEDHKRWRLGTSPSSLRGRPASLVEVSLMRAEDRYTATVRPASAETPRELGAFWAVTEDNHATQVKAGENDGATLRHDYVVRELVPVAQWRANADGRTLEFKPKGTIDPAHPRRVNLVVFDARSGRPVQAVKLGC